MAKNYYTPGDKAVHDSHISELETERGLIQDAFTSVGNDMESLETGKSDASHVHNASDVVNDSSVLGDKVSNALNTLKPTLPSSSQLVYVAKTGNDSTGDGTIINPYLTIGAALTSITDASDSKRYIIIIYPGTYAEQVTLKSFVYMIGLIQYTVFISYASGDAVIAPTGMGGFGASLKDIVIENLSSNSAHAAIRLNGPGSNLGIEGCNVITNQAVGADVEGGFLITIDTSISSSNNNGIRIRNGGFASFEGGIQSGSPNDILVDSGGIAFISGATMLYNNTLSSSGTVTLPTPSQIIKNDSSVSGASVKDAMNNIKAITDTVNKGGGTRPTTPVLYQMFFDTALATPRPIWWNGSNWVDATGSTV